MTTEDIEQPEDRIREDESDEAPEPTTIEDEHVEEPTRGELVRRRVRQVVVGVGGAVGVGLLAWGANRLLKGEPEVSIYPSPRLHPGYQAAFAESDGSPPAHWHRPASHDAMHRRVQGSFEMGKHR